MEEVHI